MSTKHLLVKGKVQGVFFRATAKEVAEKIGVTGWVKNTDDGKVEVLAQGDLEALDQFEDWCRKGPSKARVDDFQKEETEAERFAEFNVHRD